MLKNGDLRRTLLNGAMIVLPIGAIILLVLAIVQKVQGVSEPFTGRLGHPAITGTVLLILLCFLVGLLLRSAAGRAAQRVLDRRVFEHVPAYRLVKAFAGDGPLAEHGGRAMRPALAAIEEGQCPALVMDQLGDGRLIVFVPGSPAPMSGALYVFTPERVTYLDVPLLPFLKMISSWGLGLREMIEASAPSGPGTGRPHREPHVRGAELGVAAPPSRYSPTAPADGTPGSASYPSPTPSGSTG
jgi:uncharacterized membrane protein